MLDANVLAMKKVAVQIWLEQGDVFRIHQFIQFSVYTALLRKEKEASSKRQEKMTESCSLIIQS